MLFAIVNYHRTGELEMWPVYVAYPALALFGFGLLLAVLQAARLLNR